ncbi:hypothetical protein [Jonesia denitrificans]|uniref:Uncharacterized protein n=1 Tax=Jonesia denitrificans (strain ATCC 14870 / DSM 20603 / BCRC 15368 / CIP 55.134 / JCM 11481 / NBRC 15587 / NCTC 10816 / Prevot 55134) TaxID=471856 RepID=C7R144_JONDD|nr:hypothetical protein [Jonesia denitrificans]ACV09768.1 hypothetical protein Jden_2131 [Jonesia denitrificans DSM 20603]QXB43572.1 hypothetical protein I6L70_01305 [Jonesia denitrificans]SQH22374.1 Uncharacterised protein [Jonesia denitrificans]
MSETSFVKLRRIIRAESLQMGIKMSSRAADRIAGQLLEAEAFKAWCADIDARDVELFGSISEPHSDPTARTAIQRILRKQFQLERQAA